VLPVLSSLPSISPRNTSNSATSTQRADEPKGFAPAVAKDEDRAFLFSNPYGGVGQ
jgi:hypothetical protein